MPIRFGGLDLRLLRLRLGRIRAPLRVPVRAPLGAWLVRFVVFRAWHSNCYYCRAMRSVHGP